MREEAINCWRWFFRENSRPVRQFVFTLNSGLLFSIIIIIILKRKWSDDQIKCHITHYVTTISTTSKKPIHWMNEKAIKKGHRGGGGGYEGEDFPTAPDCIAACGHILVVARNITKNRCIFLSGCLHPTTHSLLPAAPARHPILTGGSDEWVAVPLIPNSNRAGKIYVNYGNIIYL